MRDWDSLGLPKIELPPEAPITPEERERRRIVVEKILALRDKIGPVDLTIEELLDYGDDDEGDDGSPTLHS
ncbi:MAG: hypothetical protein NTZ05_12810 [Chloroflexi bacterium]|nr:hypothetical protein [Chloroflexota bacterium]